MHKPSDGPVYISGPMTGRPQYNYPAFNKMAAGLREAGYEVINPAENFGGEDGRPRAEYMRLDFQHVLDASAVVALDDWETSAGASLEIAIARELGLPIFGEDGLEIPIIATQRTGETRIVDPTTGGEKGAKLAELGAVDPVALHRLAEVAGYGGQKYARGNFMKGFRWSLSYDALQRHLGSFWSGEQNDPESGLPHLAHAMWHCGALISFSERGIGTDDRYAPPLHPLR